MKSIIIIDRKEFLIVNFKRLSHFVAVAESKTLSSAAEKLHVVQPAISQSIKKLEEELGAQLFTRSRKGMKLTSEGEVFIKYAHGILDQYNRAKESVANLDKTLSGRVSVAMTASALNVLSTEIFLLIQAEFPDIELSLEEGLTANINFGLEAGWYDLVVSFDSEANEAIETVDLIDEVLYLVTPYREQSMSEIEFSSLAKYPIIQPQDQHAVSATLSKQSKELGIEINVLKTHSALHPALQIIESGSANAILPWSAIFDRVEYNRLSASKIINPDLRRRVGIIHKLHKPLTPAAIAVMAVIREATKTVHEKGNWHGELLLQ